MQPKVHRHVVRTRNPRWKIVLEFMTRTRTPYPGGEWCGAEHPKRTLPPGYCPANTMWDSKLVGAFLAATNLSDLGMRMQQNQKLRLFLVNCGFSLVWCLILAFDCAGHYFYQWSVTIMFSLSVQIVPDRIQDQDCPKLNTQIARLEPCVIISITHDPKSPNVVSRAWAWGSSCRELWLISLYGRLWSPRNVYPRRNRRFYLNSLAQSYHLVVIFETSPSLVGWSLSETLEVSRIIYGAARRFLRLWRPAPVNRRLQRSQGCLCSTELGNIDDIYFGLYSAGLTLFNCIKRALVNALQLTDKKLLGWLGNSHIAHKFVGDFECITLWNIHADRIPHIAQCRMWSSSVIGMPTQSQVRHLRWAKLYPGSIHAASGRFSGKLTKMVTICMSYTVSFHFIFAQ